MSIQCFLQKARKFEIQRYSQPHNINKLKDTHIPFSGAPFKHPTDGKKIILVIDPYCTNTFYYEFNIEDISFMEELASTTNLDGETVNTARIWVKKKSSGMRCIPFVVDQIKIK